MQVLFGLPEDDETPSAPEPIIAVPFDAPPNGGRTYHNADWRRSPQPMDFPMSTPLRGSPMRRGSLNGLRGLRGLGATDPAPGMQRVRVSVLLAPNSVQRRDLSNLAFFKDPQRVPLTHDQQGSAAQRVLENVKPTPVLAAPPVMTAVLPKGWKPGDLLQFVYVLEVDVPASTNLEKFKTDVATQVNWSIGQILGGSVTAVANVALEVLRRAGEAGGEASRVIAGSFWAMLRPLVLPAAIVGTGIAVWMFWPQISAMVRTSSKRKAKQLEAEAA